MLRFENLDIWKRSLEITEKIFDIADKVDSQRKYRFAEHLRSASLSIINIAEGFGSSSKQEFKQFLNYAHRSVFETANMVILCHRKKYLDENIKDAFLNELEQVSKMIIGFSKSL